MIQRTPSPIEAHDLTEARDLTQPASRTQNIAPKQDSGSSWQQILSQSVTRPEQLLERLGLPVERWLDAAQAGHKLFPIRVPEPFIERMQPGNPDDPGDEDGSSGHGLNDTGRRLDGRAAPGACQV